MEKYSLQQITEKVDQYIQTKKNAWAESTQRSERHRLLAIIQACPTFYYSPEDLWEAIQDRGAYTRCTMWTRAVTFAEFLGEGYKELKQWRLDNAKQFKNNYQRNTPEITYGEAKRRILSIPDTGIRSKCLQLLQGGLRYSESLTLSDGRVRGKGGKVRRVYAEPVQTEPGYNAVYKALKEIGMTPHMLRKIKATHVAKSGARPEQLCKLFGWNDFNTAQSYIDAGSEDELELIMRGDN